MEPSGGGEPNVPPRRRVWGLLLVLPLIASFVFMDAETRTLRPATRGPTSTEGLDAAATDVHLDRSVIALRAALAVMALYGLVIFAKPAR